jgi:hypothetical protein
MPRAHASFGDIGGVPRFAPLNLTRGVQANLTQEIVRRASTLIAMHWTDRHRRYSRTRSMATDVILASAGQSVGAELKTKIADDQR